METETIKSKKRTPRAQFSQETYPRKVSMFCALFGISKQAYYKKIKADRQNTRVHKCSCNFYRPASSACFFILSLAKIMISTRRF